MKTIEENKISALYPFRATGRNEGISPGKRDSKKDGALEPFKIKLDKEAQYSLDNLRRKNPPKFNKLQKCLRCLASNPRHQSLRVHAMHGVDGKTWIAYVENRTPSAWRILFTYGPDRREITILAIKPHP